MCVRSKKIITSGFERIALIDAMMGFVVRWRMNEVRERYQQQRWWSRWIDLRTRFEHVLGDLRHVHDQLLREVDDGFDNQYISLDYRGFFRLYFRSKRMQKIKSRERIFQEISTIVKAPSATCGLALLISCSGSPSTFQSIWEKKMKFDEWSKSKTNRCKSLCE